MGLLASEMLFYSFNKTLPCTLFHLRLLLGPQLFSPRRPPPCSYEEQKSSLALGAMVRSMKYWTDKDVIFFFFHKATANEG